MARRLHELNSAEHRRGLELAIDEAIIHARYTHHLTQSGGIRPLSDNLTPANLDLMHEEVLAVLASNAATPATPAPPVSSVTAPSSDVAPGMSTSTAP
jgi:hypothetical protein